MFDPLKARKSLILVKNTLGIEKILQMALFLEAANDDPCGGVRMQVIASRDIPLDYSPHFLSNNNHIPKVDHK